MSRTTDPGPTRAALTLEAASAQGVVPEILCMCIPSISSVGAVPSTFLSL